MKWIRFTSLVFAVIFAVIGLVFLFMPDKVLGLFNQLSEPFNLPQAPVENGIFFLALAAAYMYLVTVLAILIARYPDNRWFPLLLANGKLASSALSLFLFFWQASYLIYFANFLVDGLIGLAAVFVCLRISRLRRQGNPGPSDG